MMSCRRTAACLFPDSIGRGEGRTSTVPFVSSMRVTVEVAILGHLYFFFRFPGFFNGETAQRYSVETPLFFIFVCVVLNLLAKCT